MGYKKTTYYDLKNSPYTTKIEVMDNEYLFYFSTELHHIKFDANVLKYVQKEREKFEYDYGCSIVNDLIFYIRYYKLVEKRGIYIEDVENEQIINGKYDLLIDIQMSK